MRSLLIISFIICSSLVLGAPSEVSSHPICLELLRRLSVKLNNPVSHFKALNLKLSEHRDAIAQIIDQDPLQWHLLKKIHPEYASELEPVLFVPLDQVGPLAGMQPKAIDLALKNMGGLQLETQCCVQCPWCGFSINKKSKYQQMPVAMARTMLMRVGEINIRWGRTDDWTSSRGNLQMLYYESDPFDYRMPLEPGSTVIYYYPEMHLMASRYTGRAPYVSTAIPKGKESKVLEFIDRGLHNNTQLRLSYSDHNSKRLKATVLETHKSFEDEIVDRIENKRLEMVGELVRYQEHFSTISKKQLALAFSNLAWKLGLSGARRFLRPDPREPSKLLLTFEELRTIYYLKSLSKEEVEHELEDAESRAFMEKAVIAINFIWDAYSSYQEGPLYIQDTRVREIGRAFTSLGESVMGIGCFDGVLVTPTNAYNLVQLPGATAQFKDGQVVVELSKQVPKENLPEIAPIQEILRYGIVEAQGTKELMKKSLESRKSFILVDYDGNRHQYMFVRVGDGFIAKRLPGILPEP